LTDKASNSNNSASAGHEHEGPATSAPEHAPHKHGSEGSGRPLLVLAGNPNVGKSVIFNYLSGLYVEVSNFPGTTIEISRATYGEYDLADTPGIYGVSSFNDEETTARDLILSADVVLDIVDAVHLERDLFLTVQLIEMGLRVCVVVNMMDEARKRRMHIDLDRLEKMLGVPVQGVTAVRKHGLDGLHDLIRRARMGVVDEQLHSRLHDILGFTGSQAEALMVLEGDAVLRDRHGVPASVKSMRDELYVRRRNRVNAVNDAVVRDDHAAKRFSELAGRMAVHPVAGFPLFALVLLMLYWFVGVFVAQDLVSVTEKDIGRGFVERHIKSFIARHAGSHVALTQTDPNGRVTVTGQYDFPNGTEDDHPRWVEVLDKAGHEGAGLRITYTNPVLTVFFGEFGAISMTLTYLVFLLLPLVLGFYFALSILEDSGYLPRLAALADRSLRSIGLNGRAVIPLILGFGCVTMATITTRLLGTQREKTIATAILQLAIPCSAQLGVIGALLAGAGLEATLVYTAIILVFLIAVGSILNKLMPGEVSPLLLNLPPMRLPRFNNVFKKTAFRAWFFMKEAAPWFFIGAFIISVMQVLGWLDTVQYALHPLVVHWLKLPAEASTAFVMGLVRRDFGAAGFYSLTLSPFQTVAALVTMTLFVPCVASLMVMFKERGLRQGMIVWAGSLVLAFVVGGLAAQVFVH
jgi:ferrous iron transport protein B